MIAIDFLFTSIDTIDTMNTVHRISKMVHSRLYAKCINDLA